MVENYNDIVFNDSNIVFGNIYRPITAYLDGANLILGFSTTSFIKKLFLINFLNLKIPHLETSLDLTFLDAIIDELYFWYNLSID